MTTVPEPSYLALHRSGELARRADVLEARLAPCVVCPRECRVDRLRGETKFCGVAARAIVSSYAPHFGEEPVLSGTHLPRGAARGAGNIFFGRCNLHCVHCQNAQISQGPRPAPGDPREVDAARLASIMLELQAEGCHNIGFVSPSHVAPQIARAVDVAAGRGLALPLIYNTNGYDALETLRLLDGAIDVYLPDLKYSDEAAGLDLSKAPDYVARARAAIKEMHRQVGDELVLDERGLARRGLIIRLLILPNDQAGLRGTLEWIRAELGPRVALSVMSQYFPANEVGGERHPLMQRPIRRREYDEVLDWLDELGFENGWVQPFDERAADYYRPDFDDPDRPFKDAKDFR